MKEYGIVDLHTHTTFSDGELTPEELVRYAAENKVNNLSITDHDTISGISRAMIEAEKVGIKIIPGIELSTKFNGELHILGYNIDINNEMLLDNLESLVINRKDRMLLMIRRLKKIDLIISEKDITQGENGVVGRLHIAKALLKKGYVNSLDDAFEKYLGKGCPAYIEGIKYTPEQAIKIITEAGGVAVLAHPFSLRMEDWNFTQLLESLVFYGLKGMEVYYPNYSQVDIDKLHNLCNRFNLAESCGTDYHGKLRSDLPPGTTSVNYKPTSRDKSILGLSF